MDIRFNELVKNNGGQRFIITYNNGTKEVARLFYTDFWSCICKIPKGSRSKGYAFYTGDVKDIVLAPVKSEVEVCRDNLKKIVKYLSASGFWAPMLKGSQHLLTFSDEELLEARKYDKYRALMSQFEETGMGWWGFDCFLNLFDTKIKTMRWDKWDKEYYKGQIKLAIAEKRNYRGMWRNGYDNSFEITFNDNYPRAWYSEEYKDCGNGHYYFLLDDCHVLFGEND